MTLLDLTLLTAPVPSTTSAMLWTANHTGGDLPVTGGRNEARMLVGSIDGNRWPWTCIKLVNDERWFQVLGTWDACLLEVGATGGHTWTVAKTETPSPHWVALPPECAYWVGAVREDELFTTAEAFEWGMNWLNGGPQLTLRAIYPSGHRY